MTLDNLVGISLDRITPDKSNINRLLAAAERNLQDSNIPNLSNENRFDAAYKSIMQIANAALQARGYRTLTSKPGHHQTMLQCLTKTMQIELDQLMLLEALRKQRNVIDYSGDLVPDGTVKECIVQAGILLHLAKEKF